MTDHDAQREAVEAALGRPSAGSPSLAWQTSLPSTESPPAGDLAAWGHRAGAYLIDCGGAFLVGIGVGWIANLAGAPTADIETAAFLGVIAGWILCTSGLSALTDGRSLGKLVAGTRVVRSDGSRVGFWSSFVRDTLARILYAIPPFALFDVLMPLGERREAVRDKMLGTRVVKAHPGRTAALVVGVVMSAIALVGLGAGAAEVDTYTREEFIAHCRTDTSSETFCGCHYDHLLAKIGREAMNDYEYLTVDELPRDQRRAWDRSFDECF